VITEYAVCALPEDHRDWRHLVLRVKRRGNTDRWVIEHGAFYWTGDDWYPSMGQAAEYDDAEALHLAEYLKAQVEMNGLTAADLLARGAR
jgi:hypothetical protein